MEKIKQAILDAGPYIHLHEISRLNFTDLFEEIFITSEIKEECKRIEEEINKLKNVAEKNLTTNHKDFAKYLIEGWDLDLGEATGLALCKQEKVKFFFTDDLEARHVGNSLGFQCHGTIAIILRRLKNNMIDKNEAKKSIEALYEKSSLFITSDLKALAIKEIDLFKR
ncbi:hypothetical protein HYY69_02260 [Candidatus Woesearchaeota archaeon]|nr:hypothetical protein [Candidatus Woesearchaeota archaeon]